MRASLASLLVTSLVLTSTPALAGGKKGRPKKAPKKKAAPTEKAPAQEPAPTPEGGTPAPTPLDGAPASPPSGLGDPANAAPPPPSPAPQTPATPAGPPPGSPAAKARAKELQKEATKLYNVQQYARAAELYQEAYLLDPNPAYLYASAQSQRLGGDCTKALQSYQAYLRANPPESEKAKAQANIERCEQDLREREAAANADQISVPYDVPAPPPPPPEEIPPPPPPPPPGKTYVLGHVMLGLGIIGLGGGSYLFITGRKTLSDHNSAPTYDEYVGGLGDVNDAKKKQQIGLYAVGGGALLVGGAIAFYVLHSRSRPDAEEQPPVQASVTPQGATVTFTRNF